MYTGWVIFFVLEFLLIFLLWISVLCDKSLREKKTPPEQERLRETEAPILKHPERPVPAQKTPQQPIPTAEPIVQPVKKIPKAKRRPKVPWVERPRFRQPYSRRYGRPERQKLLEMEKKISRKYKEILNQVKKGSTSRNDLMAGFRAAIRQESKIKKLGYGYAMGSLLYGEEPVENWGDLGELLL